MTHFSINTLFFTLYLCASFVVAESPQQSSVDYERRKALLVPENTIQALENILQYFTKIIHNATVDFAFGIRVVEGEVRRILTMADRGLSTLQSDQLLYDRLTTLHKTSKKAVDESIQHLKAANGLYFEKTGFLINDPWMPYQVPPQLTERNNIAVFPDRFQAELQEEESDECMNAITGQKNYQKCTLENCWKLMTKPGSSLYTTTHQILWLLLGSKAGCGQVLNQAAMDDGHKNGMVDILKQKCASVVIEMEALSMDGVQSVAQDIFLEQGFVCGSIGFMDAVRPEWLVDALKWQGPTLGCLGSPDDGNPEDMFKELQFWINIKKNEWKSRKLHFDTTLKDGCSTHKTAVAATFFATYLRLFFHPAYKEHMLDPYIGIDHQQKQLLTATLLQVFFTAAMFCTCVVFRKKVLLVFNYVALKMYSRKQDQSFSVV